MNNSMIVFLINDSVRAIKGEYEVDGALTMFKTMDPEIRVDDLVVVQSTTRHEMTVVRVKEVDVDVDFDTSAEIKWAVHRIDRAMFDEVLRQEGDAIKAVQQAEKRRKKEELRDSLFKDHQERIKTLELAQSKDDEITE